MTHTPVFSPADILLPRGGDMAAWSVIACDQFTSDRGYWDELSALTAGRLSTLPMILPEAYMNDEPVDLAARRRWEAMAAALDSDSFDTLKNSFVYVERQVSCGLRRGLVGALDLDAYDYSPVSSAPVRASERTVLERLPVRTAVRRGAPLDLQHVMLLADDPGDTILGPLTAKKAALPGLYDFDLAAGGGHISGWAVSGVEAEAVSAALEGLCARPLGLVVGDGNHSLAAAKLCWEEKKAALAPGEAESCPARFALVELCSVYDSGVAFEPIHRAVFGPAAGELIPALEALSAPGGRPIRAVLGEREATVYVPGSLGQVIGAVQDAIDALISARGGSVDYIHDDDALKKLTDAGAAGVYMPPMEKSDLFRTVEKSGVFPRKSFSIGQARDKRYYLEGKTLCS